MELEETKNHINSSINKKPLNQVRKVAVSDIDYSYTTFEDEYVFITDSNLAKVNTSIMNHGSSCAKYFCPTLPHIEDLLNNVLISKEPNVIFIHCGTNHLGNSNFCEETLQNQFSDILEKIKTTCPNAKIIISSILPRQEHHLQNYIQSINDFYVDVLLVMQVLYSCIMLT